MGVDYNLRGHSERLKKTVYPPLESIKEAIIMGIDPLGMVFELYTDNPVTIGGRANKRYMEALEREYVPEDYNPGLPSRERLKRYFAAEDMRMDSGLVVWPGVITTIFSWPALLVTVPVNLYRVIRRGYS